MAKKRGLDLSKEEAHRMWSASVSGKELGAFSYMFGLQNTGVVAKRNTEKQGDIDKENNARRKVISRFLRSWADNLEGK